MPIFPGDAFGIGVRMDGQKPGMSLRTGRVMAPGRQLSLGNPTSCTKVNRTAAAKIPTCGDGPFAAAS
jgi:hypothetical protein